MSRRSARILPSAAAEHVNGLEAAKSTSVAEPAKAIPATKPSTSRGRKRQAEETLTPSKRVKRGPTTVKEDIGTSPDLKEELQTNVQVINKGRKAHKAEERRVKAAENQVKAETQDQTASVVQDSPKKGRKGAKKQDQPLKEEVKEEEEEVAAAGAEAGAKEKPKRKRKTKEEKEAEAMPLAARTTGLKMYIGAHVSSAKGVQNAVSNCVHIGGNAFALFLRSQRKWANPPLQDEHTKLFKANCHEHKYDAASHVLPHGSYLVNLAQKEPEKAKQAYNCFVDDLQRCETLGIKLYNFHPGSTGSHPRPEAIGRIASALNRAHKSTSSVKTVLENMAGSGNVIGSTFEDLRDIIDLVDDKTRVGVCLDTCHAFTAGYDLRTPAAFSATLSKFSATVGLPYLSALHLNDSKAPFASHRDLHQNIGLGFLGLRAFWNVMNEPSFQGLPMVLETPIDREGKEDKSIWATEIKLLEGLTGVDLDTAEFRAKEKELAEKGEEERKKYQEAFDRKQQKASEKEAKGKAKGKKKGAASGEDSEASASDGEDEM